MKKYLVALVAMVMIFSMSMTAFAAVSPTSKVDTVTGVKDENGNAVEVKNVTNETAIASMATETKVLETVKALNSKAQAASLLAFFDINGTPGTYTFSVSGVKAGDNIMVLHFNTAKNAWESLAATVKDGEVSAKFSSFSPVAIVKVSENAAAAPKTDGTKSDKTGENGVAGAGVAALAALAGIIAVSRRKTV